MVNISKEILEKYGIYKTRKLTKNEEVKFLKMKSEVEKIIDMPIERLYLVDECAWGKEAEKAIYRICILVDRRCKDLKNLENLLKDYCKNNNVEMLIWTLCQFEKRKNATNEKDYYIDKYGIKVYDSGKQPEIDENVTMSEYAKQNYIYKNFYGDYTDIPDSRMRDLIRIYILKIGYYTIKYNSSLTEHCDFIKLISNDEQVKILVDTYLSLTENKEKIKMIYEFEKYLDSVKQVRFPMKLEETPSMDVYGQLLNERKRKNQPLDFDTLRKDDLYIMYLIQDISTQEIADLYGVENKKISAKRDNWQIKLREKAFLSEDNVMKEAIKFAKEQNDQKAYALLKKIGMMQFEKYLFPIIRYMMDGDRYMLREFWQFAKDDDEENVIGNILLKCNKSNYYKINLCIDLLLQNELIKEVKFKEYKVTNKGKKLVNYCDRNDIDEITIPVICECFDEVNFYNLYYENGYPSDFERVTWKKLYDSWKMCCSEFFPELLEINNVPLDKKTVHNQEETALVWMYLFFENLKWKNKYPQQWDKDVLINSCDILNPIKEEIAARNLSIIPKIDNILNKFLDISNLCKYVKIEELSDIVMIAATSCAYLLNTMER